MKFIATISAILLFAIFFSTDVAFDSDGHGPDPDTAEYARALSAARQRREGHLLILTITTGVSTAVLFAQYVYRSSVSSDNSEPC